MLNSDEPASGPSSTIATFRPASARISAVTPPPAPLPTTTTSHSISRSRSSAAASIAFQPRARPSLIGSVTATAALSFDHRRAGIADRGPRCRVAVPRGLQQLGERLVAGALDVEMRVAPAREERGDVLGRRLLERGPEAGEHEARGREAQDREELVDLLLDGRGESRYRAVEARHRLRDRLLARTGFNGQRTGQHDGNERGDGRGATRVEEAKPRRGGHRLRPVEPARAREDRGACEADLDELAPGRHLARSEGRAGVPLAGMRPGRSEGGAGAPLAGMRPRRTSGADTTPLELRRRFGGTRRPRGGDATTH